VHFEIPVDDPERAAGFYRDALGWEISRFGDEAYWLVRAGQDEEPGANGALVGRGVLHGSPVLTVGVDDVADALSRVQRCGGTVAQEKLPFPAWAGRRTSWIPRATRSGCSSRTRAPAPGQ
jgi:predicted enzyme related to lactoylglutathione lyase